MSQEPRKQYRIRTADFVTSVYTHATLPTGDLPEIAFAGRSNVGKSSLLNALCERKSLAQTSKTPGRTQALNFFFLEYLEVEGEEMRSKQLHLVDLPGYGYARAPGAVRGKWGDLIEPYLLNRPQLATVVLLVDSRRDPREEETWFMNSALAGQLCVVMTKADKLKRNDRKKRRLAIASALNVHPDRVFLTSTNSGSVEGIEELRAALFAEGIPSEKGGARS